MARTFWRDWKSGNRSIPCDVTRRCSGNASGTALQMKRFFASVDRWLIRLYRFSGYLAAVCLVVIAILVLTSIISRLFSTYIPGLTEFSGYAMVAASFLALAYTFHQHGHIRVEIVISRFGKLSRWYAELWCLSVAAVVSTLLSFYMARLVYWSWKFNEHSEGSDAILLWKPQSVAMVGAFVLTVCILHHLIKFVTGRNTHSLQQWKNST